MKLLWCILLIATSMTRHVYCGSSSRAFDTVEYGMKYDYWKINAPHIYSRYVTRRVTAANNTCDGIKFDENSAIECVMNVIDGIVEGTPGKGDKRVTPLEIHTAMETYLKWYEKLFVTTQRVMKDCSGDLWGPITAETFHDLRKTCLPKQSNLCQLKVICDRASLALKTSVY